MPPPQVGGWAHSASAFPAATRQLAYEHRPIDAVGDTTGDTDAEARGARRNDDEEPCAARDLTDAQAAALVWDEPLHDEPAVTPSDSPGLALTPPPGWEPPGPEDEAEGPPWTRPPRPR